MIAESLREEYPMADYGPEREREPPAPPEILAEAEDLFAQWLEGFEFGPLEPLGIETHIRAPLGFSDHVFSGHLDLVCDWRGMAVIDDWKSQRIMPGSLKNDPQLASNAWSLVQHWPQYKNMDILLRKYYIRHGMRYLEAVISPAGRSNVEGTLVQFAEQLERMPIEPDWPARPCQQCVFCGLYCPLQGETIRPPQSSEAAQEVAGLCVALGQQYGQCKDALKVWCAEHGPVEAAGKRFGMEQGEKLSCGLTPRELFEQYGDVVLDWLRLDERQSNTFWRNPPDGLTLETIPTRAAFTERKKREE